MIEDIMVQFVSFGYEGVNWFYYLRGKYKLAQTNDDDKSSLFSPFGDGFSVLNIENVFPNEPINVDPYVQITLFSPINNINMIYSNVDGMTMTWNDYNPYTLQFKPNAQQSNEVPVFTTIFNINGDTENEISITGKIYFIS